MEQVEQSRADRLELISKLAGIAAVDAALEEIREMKRTYEANLGRALLTGTRTSPPVNQREIDYQRGFYRGLLWGYAVLPKNAGPQLERLLEKEFGEKESDTA